MSEFYDWAAEEKFEASRFKAESTERDASDVSYDQLRRRALSRGTLAAALILSTALSLASTPGERPTVRLEQKFQEAEPSTDKPQEPSLGSDDIFRYDYQGISLLCSVGEPHTVQSGETLYGLVANKYPRNESAVYYLLPAIKKLNVERKQVKNPNKLAIGDEVLTFDKCQMRSWWSGDDPHNGYAWVNYLDEDVFMYYRYDFTTNQYGERTSCRGDAAYCGAPEATS